MNQIATRGFVLTRTDFGDADRILTLLTPDYGKLRLMAKGVRRVKSKLVGGIELFSVSDITFIRGRGDIGTLLSARLDKHYARIVTDIDRTMLGYEFIKQLNKTTEDEPEAGYFHLLQQAFVALDDDSVSLNLIKLWFGAQLLRLGGHTPNLQTEPNGIKLATGQTYEFSFDDVAFVARPDAPYDTDTIKFLRLVFSENRPLTLAKVNDVGGFVERTGGLVNHLRQQYQN